MDSISRRRGVASSRRSCARRHSYIDSTAALAAVGGGFPGGCLTLANRHTGHTYFPFFRPRERGVIARTYPSSALGVRVLLITRYPSCLNLD